MSAGQVRHELLLPDAVSQRVAAMAKMQKRSKSDLLAEMVDAYLNWRSGSQLEDHINAKLDRVIRVVTKTNTETVAISYCLSRFIRHELIYAAALPPPGKDAEAFGEKRYQEFLDVVAKLIARDTNQAGQAPAEPAK